MAYLLKAASPDDGSVVRKDEGSVVRADDGAVDRTFEPCRYGIDFRPVLLLLLTEESV